MYKLNIGDKTPNFCLPDQDGTSISLNDYKGKRILLYFYPKAMTPGCTIQACNLRDNMDEIKYYNVEEVLGISTDKFDKLLQFSEKELLNFTLLSDVDHKVCKKFGVWREKKFIGKIYNGIHRTSFLIDNHGFIEKIFENFKINEHHCLIMNYLKEHAKK